MGQYLDEAEELARELSSRVPQSLGSYDPDQGVLLTQLLTAIEACVSPVQARQLACSALFWPSPGAGGSSVGGVDLGGQALLSAGLLRVKPDAFMKMLLVAGLVRPAALYDPEGAMLWVKAELVPFSGGSGSGPRPYSVAGTKLIAT